jgi:hypothetical protein
MRFLKKVRIREQMTLIKVCILPDRFFIFRLELF